LVQYILPEVRVLDSGRIGDGMNISVLHEIEDMLQHRMSCEDISEELNLELSVVEEIYCALGEKMSAGH
jgi:hypothetical protein